MWGKIQLAHDCASGQISQQLEWPGAGKKRHVGREI